MRVNIEHKEVTKGLFSKTTTHNVICRVEFTQEELHIIKRNKLESHVVLECPVPDGMEQKFRGIEDVWNVRVSTLLDTKSPREYPHKTIGGAKLYEQELVEGLKGLKNVLQVNAEAPEQSKSFEL